LAGHGHTVTGEGEEASQKQLTRKTMEGACTCTGCSGCFRTMQVKLNVPLRLKKKFP
jgi:hypothetical protein